MTPEDAQIRNLRRHRARRELFVSGSPPITLGHRHEIWEFAVQQLGPDSEVAYLEFGVAQGASMRFFANSFVNPATRLVGFDSFEGLPEDWDVVNNLLPKETFSTQGW